MADLVAGGAGFIGSHLCERLIDKGHTVICADNFLTGRRANVEHLLSSPRFALFELDLIEGAPEVEAERIYHLASPASPPGYTRFPIETMRVNSEGTRHLLISPTGQAPAFFMPAPLRFTGTCSSIPSVKNTAETLALPVHARCTTRRSVSVRR